MKLLMNIVAARIGRLFKVSRRHKPVANSQVTAVNVGSIGSDPQYAGVAPIPAAGDLVSCNVTTGTFEAYDIAKNTIREAAPLGRAGFDWQSGGSAAKSPSVSAASSSQVAQLVQAMAGFGGDSAAADGLRSAPLGADAPEQTFLTAPPQG